MFTIKRNGFIDFSLLYVVVLAIFLRLFTILGISDEIPKVITIWLLAVGSLMILLVLKKILCCQSFVLVVYTGYVLRCVIAIIDVYGRSGLTDFIKYDAEMFYNEVHSLYHHISIDYISTPYAYVLRFFFEFVGDNRFVAQYINIVFWVFSIAVIYHICTYFKTEEKSRFYIILLWSFLPMGIFLPSMLLRESIEMFFGLWSFEHFLYWMKEGRFAEFVKAFLYVIPAMILHSASVMMWVCYVLIYMFWNVHGQHFYMQKKTGIVACGSVLGLVLIWNTPIGRMLFWKLGNDFSLYGITHVSFEVGGSDYLVNMDCTSWIQFVPYTIIRMFYFMFSPLPTEARGFMDFATFLMDGFPLMIVLIYIVYRTRRNREVKSYVYTSLLAGMLFVAIFAWATRAAGTAVRHRYLAWSMFIVGLCICCGKSPESESIVSSHANDKSKMVSKSCVG